MLKTTKVRTPTKQINLTTRKPHKTRQKCGPRKADKPNNPKAHKSKPKRALRSPEKSNELYLPRQQKTKVFGGGRGGKPFFRKVPPTKKCSDAEFTIRKTK